MTAFVLVVLAALPTPKSVVLDDATRAKLKEIAFQAARDGDVTTLRSYFAAGLPVNDANPRGDSLLTLAAYYGRADAAELILAQPGVKVDARNRMGLTALSAAAFKGSVEVARLLVARKADVNAANESGQTPLMFAALTGRTEVVKYLLEVGAKPDAADRDGNTPLSLAKGQGADAVVALLEAALRKRVEPPA